MTGRVPRVAVFLLGDGLLSGISSAGVNALCNKKTREGNLIRELSAPAGEGTVLKISVLGR